MTSYPMMQPLQSVAHMIHPDANYAKLLADFAAVDPTPEAQVKFCADNLGGGATLGLMQAFHKDLNLTERGREALKLILTCEAGRNMTGVAHHLNRAPGMLVTDPILALLPSSSVLTHDDIRKVTKAVKAKGGCTIDVLCQPNRKANNDCTGFHTEIIARPISPEDGQAIALSVVLVPQDTGDWKVATQIIQKVVGCKRLGPVEPTDDLSRAFCSPKDTKALGPANMLLALRRDQWAGTLAEFTPLRKVASAPIDPYHPLPFSVQPTEFVMSFDADEDAFSLFLRILALQEISVSRGETLTFGSHYGFASCEAYAVTVLKSLFPVLFKNIDPAFLTLHQLTTTLAEKANRLYLAKIDNPRIYDFGDDDKRDNAFEEVTDQPARFHAVIEEICTNEKLNLQPSAEYPSWNNWFNNALAVPKDHHAQNLYLQFAKAALTLLEEKAEKLTGKSISMPQYVEDTEEFDDLVNNLEADNSSWASLLQRQSDPAVEKLMEAMRGSDLASMVDEMSLEDLRKDMSAISRNPAQRSQWDTALDALVRLGDFATQIETDFANQTPAASSSLSPQRTISQFRSFRQKPERRQPSDLPPITEVTEADIRSQISAAIPSPVEVESEGTPDPEELRRQAFELIHIMIINNPSRGKRILAACLAIFKAVPDVGIALMFFWQVIRYAASKDDGIRVSAGMNAVAVTSYTLAQPMLEVVTEHVALAIGAHRAPVASLPYPRRFIQEYSYALKGGPLIGFLSKFINDIDHPKTGGGRLGWELLAVIPGLLIVSADRILEDYYIFKQKYEILSSTDPVRLQFGRALKQILKDFLSIKHWVTKRIVTFAALYAHEWTASSWYYLFQNIDKPYDRSYVGAVQFGTFFVSFVFLSQIAEKLFDVSATRAKRITANMRRRLPDVERSA
jgi:hypothetical protein